MPDDLVLVDTDVWSCVILANRDRDPRVTAWRRMLLGRQPLIAAQTEGELRFWGLSRHWGPTRMTALEAHLRSTPTIPVTPAVIGMFATVRAECKESGRQLAEKHNMGDAWIAATAKAHDLPLLSGDQIYDGVPGLNLLKDDG